MQISRIYPVTTYTKKKSCDPAATSIVADPTHVVLIGQFCILSRIIGSIFGKGTFKTMQWHSQDGDRLKRVIQI